ncbi:MAG: CCXG family PEP-CTERM protein [Granulosicoccaceae bacterium]
MLLTLVAVLGPNTAWTAAWWNCDWHHRTEITVQSTETANNRAVNVELSSANFDAAYALTPDGADLRVLGSDNNTVLDHHLQSWDASARTALLTVRMPVLAASTPTTIYLYYGNTIVSSGVSAVPSNANPQSTYTNSGWRYHTKNSTLDPSNEAQARSEFENAPDVGGYGCAVVGEVLNQSNRNTFNGVHTDYGLYAETHFEVTTPGVWKFRSAVDYGRGGAFYIDHQPVTERWNEDLWWAHNYNHSDVLTGSVFLDAGFHYFETLGYEGCCDGPVSVQYQLPGSNIWQELSSANINLLNAGCPVGSQSFQYVKTDAPNRFSGQAFLDNGDSGIAHNASPEGNESGIAGINVTVAVVNNSASNTIATEADGSWNTCFFEDAIGNDVRVSMPIPAEHYSVSESTSVVNSDQPLNATLRFPVVGNSNYLVLNTGFITFPELISDNTIEVGAGLTGLLPHRYVPSSDADVSFQISQLQHQQPGVYNYSVFQDLDCNGELDSPAVPLVNPVTAQIGQNICLLIRVDGSASVVGSSLLKLRIDAATSFSGIAQSHANTNTDMVTGAAPIALVLVKSVCNATTGACDLVSGNGFTSSNEGKPDDELVYRLEFSSLVSTLQNVAVLDNVPAYTKLKPSSISVVAQPPGMNCTIAEPVDQSVTNFTGTVKWQCTGQVDASQSGVVAFSVLID